MPTVSLHTLGCKLNQAETLTIGKQFLDRGYAVVDFGRPADVCVINTCSVTARADRECRQLIRRALRSGEDTFVVVTGCYAQLAPEEVASISGVDLVLGAREKFALFEHAGALRKNRHAMVAVSDIDTVEEFGPAWSTDAGGGTRAYLKVQDGCDYSCSFCTIPLARGASRSQPITDCVAQAHNLAREGYREIVLTGVNVGDYGEGEGLLPLLRALGEVKGIERIRISSIEPNLLTDEIIDLVADHPKLCKHFHIPLQSGHDETLKAMRRRYTTARYSEVIARVRGRIPGCGIGADVIVGFPGETEEYFTATHRFLAELPLSYLHVFTYSERPNTPATALPGGVEPKVRFRRNDALRLLGQKKKRAFLASEVGNVVDVLMEGTVEDGLRTGLTSNYIRVALPAGETRENTMVTACLTGVRGDACVGTILKQEAAA